MIVWPAGWRSHCLPISARPTWPRRSRSSRRCSRELGHDPGASRVRPSPAPRTLADPHRLGGHPRDRCSRPHRVHAPARALGRDDARRQGRPARAVRAPARAQRRRCAAPRSRSSGIRSCSSPSARRSISIAARSRELIRRVTTYADDHDDVLVATFGGRLGELATVGRRDRADLRPARSTSACSGTASARRSRGHAAARVDELGIDSTTNSTGPERAGRRPTYPVTRAPCRTRSSRDD